jgi:hypothetical protein
MLKYNSNCVWLYDENDNVIANDSPPEWKDDNELNSLLLDAKKLYNSFFICEGEEVKYIGCPDNNTRQVLIALIDNIVSILNNKNNGKYIIRNDMGFDF